VEPDELLEDYAHTVRDMYNQHLYNNPRFSAAQRSFPLTVTGLETPDGRVGLVAVNFSVKRYPAPDAIDTIENVICNEGLIPVVHHVPVVQYHLILVCHLISLVIIGGLFSMCRVLLDMLS